MNSKIILPVILILTAVVLSGCLQQPSAPSGEDVSELTEQSVSELPSKLTNDSLKELDKVSEELEKVANINLGIESVEEITGKAAETSSGATKESTETAENAITGKMVLVK